MIGACRVGGLRTAGADRDGSDFEERRFTGVGGDEPLAEAAVGLLADRFPRRLAREHDAAVFRRLAARIARGDQRQRLAAVVELEMRRHPHEIPEVFRRFERHPADAGERHPVVAAVDDRLEHRAKT
jgi:hypothetical protein